MHALHERPLSRDKDKEISLTSIAAFFGKNIGWLSVIRISRTEFWGVGVTTGTVPYFDENRRMSVGEEFDLGYTFDSFYLTWRKGNIGMVDATKTIEGAGYMYGLGLARMEAHGVKLQWPTSGGGGPTQATIEEEIEGYGVGVTIKIRYGTKPLTSSTNAYFQANADIIVVTEVGGSIKAGYEAGLLTRLSKKCTLRPYIGGYFWPLTNWETNFAGMETDFGYSLGLQFDYVW